MADGSIIKSDGTRQLRLMLGAAVVGVSCALFAPGAVAQQVAVIVNGEPITTYDIEQRAKLIQLQTHKASPRDEILNLSLIHI